MRKIIITIISILLLTSVMAQTPKKVGQDSSRLKAVENYRQTFWDNPPKHIKTISDFEYLFTFLEKKQLDTLIRKFEKETSIEIAIITIDTIQSSKEKFDSLALHVANTWKLGKTEKHYGILIAITHGNRKMRIENSRGIEELISDKETKKIIDNFFIPEFKKDDYFTGTLNGLNELMRLLKQNLKKHNKK